MADSNSILGNLALALARLGSARPRLVLVCGAVLAITCVAFACTNLRFLTSRDDMISPSKEVQRRWKDHLARVGTEDDMVVVVAGNSEEAMRPAIDNLVAQLRNEPGRFQRIWHEADLTPLADRALQLCPPDRLNAILGQVRSMRPLLELPLAWNLFTLQNFVYETRMRIKGLNGEADLARRDKATQKPGAETNAAVLDGFAHILDQARGALASGIVAGSPWPAVKNDPQAARLHKAGLLMAPGGRLAFILVSPVTDPANPLNANKASVDRLRSLVSEVERHHKNLEMGVTGLPVLEHDEMEASQGDTTRSSWLAFVGVLVLYVVVFRTWQAPVISAVPLLLGTVMALGWAALTVGHLNLLSATFAVMLIGMGDYSVLYVSRYLAECSIQENHGQALEATARSLGGSVATAALTSALAFMAAMLSDFQAVAELGWIAGSGLLFCAGAALALVPALLTLLKPQPSARPSPVSVQRLPMDFRMALSVAALALLCGLGTVWLKYDHNLLHLQSPTLPSVVWEHRLLEATPGASWHALVWANSRDEAIACKEQLARLPEVSMVTEVASLSSEGQSSSIAAIGEIARLLERLPSRNTHFQHPRPNPEQLGREIDLLLTALIAGPPPDEPYLSRIITSAKGLRGELDRLKEQATPLLAQFDNTLAEGLLQQLHELKAMSSIRPITLHDIPQSLRERHTDADGRYLLRVFARQPLWESHHLEQFIHAVSSVAPEATGKPYTTWEGLIGMQWGFIRAGLLALAAIVIILLFDLQHLMDVLLALIPLTVGVATSLGAFGWLGWPLNPANMIALPLIVGVGVDNGVHVIHDWRARRISGSTYQIDTGTSRGILVAGLTTIIGFGALMISHHRGLAGLGAILALGVSGSLITALTLLPQILNSMAAMRRSTKPATQTTDSENETARATWARAA